MGEEPGTVLSVIERHVDLNQDSAQMSLSVKPALSRASAVLCPAVCSSRLRAHIRLILINVPFCDFREVLASCLAVSRVSCPEKGSKRLTAELIPPQCPEGGT